LGYCRRIAHLGVEDEKLVLGRFDRSGFEFAEAVEAVFAQGSFKLLVLREAASISEAECIPVRSR
jgi:hypothetical protein